MSDLSNRTAALEAAQKRAQAAAQEAIQASSDDSPAAVPIPPNVRIAYLKTINDQILEKNKRPEAMDALRLIETLLTNAQKDESKRSIRLSNPAIKRRLVDVTGAQDYLLSCCWAPKTVAFEPHLVYPAAPNARQSQALDFGFRVLNERLQVLEERFSKAQEAAQLHKLEEDARVGRAMAEFKEDREKNKVRAEREKLARAAQEEQDRLEALRQQEQQQQSDAGSAHPGSINDASWASGMPGHLLVESQSEEAREDKKDV